MQVLKASAKTTSGTAKSPRYDHAREQEFFVWIGIAVIILASAFALYVVWMKAAPGV